MANVQWRYYEGNVSGPALLLPPGEQAHKADLYVIPENGTDAGYVVKDVPRRDEGGGHTFRDAK